jgi:hypothetical protein
MLFRQRLEEHFMPAFNEEAVRFAEKYRIVPGAGSDSHVAQGLGSVMIRLHDFDGPEEFLKIQRAEFQRVAKIVKEIGIKPQ